MHPKYAKGMVNNADPDQTARSSLTVGKPSLWYLSFVYTSNVSLPVQSALNFRKQTGPFEFTNLTSDTYTIICGVKISFFYLNYFLLVFCDYLPHLWNRSKYSDSMSVLGSQKTLTGSS